MRHSFKVMHDELYTVKIRISPAWARWVGEKVWHESQKVTKLPDGGLQIWTRDVKLNLGKVKVKDWSRSSKHNMEAEKFRDVSLDVEIRSFMGVFSYELF